MPIQLSIFSDYVDSENLLPDLQKELIEMETVSVALEEKDPTTKDSSTVLTALINGGFLLFGIFLTQLFTFLIKVWEKSKDTEKEEEEQSALKECMIIRGKKGAYIEVPMQVLRETPGKIRELVDLVKRMEEEEGVQFIKTGKGS